MYFINGYYSSRFIKYSIPEQIKDIFSIFLLAIGVGAIVFALDNAITELPDFVRLIIGGGMGVGLYLIGAKVFKMEAYGELKNIVNDKLKAKILSSTKK